MDFNEETVKTVQGRLDILRKGIVSEEKSVNYYQTLLEKTPEDSEEYIGVCRMYTDLMEEKKTAC